MRAGRITAAALVAGSVLAVAAPPALAASAALAAAPRLSSPAGPPTAPVHAPHPAPAGPSPTAAALDEPAGPAAPAVNGDSITAPGEFGGLVTSFGFSVTPATVGPGGTVTLRATGCATQATASAPALLDDVRLGKGNGPGQSATVTLRADATPGTQYEVAFTCGTEQGSTPLRISAGGATSAVPSPSRGAVQNALGNSSSGPDDTEIAVGSVLVAVAGALVLYRLRTPRH